MYLLINKLSDLKLRYNFKKFIYSFFKMGFKKKLIKKRLKNIRIYIVIRK